MKYLMIFGGAFLIGVLCGFLLPPLIGDLGAVVSFVLSAWWSWVVWGIFEDESDE